MEKIAHDSKKITVAHYPDNKNPYMKLMTEALGQNGIKVKIISKRLLFPLESLVGKSDIIHLHWISPGGSNSLKVILKLLILHSGILMCKLRKKKIFWTVHNLTHHEKEYQFLDNLNSKIVAKLADCVLVHGYSAKKMVINKFNIAEEKIKFVPHGNYDGHVTTTNNKSKEEIREKNNLPVDTRVFLFFGQIRPYKGVLELIESFKRINDDAFLIIAGLPNTAKLKFDIQDLSYSDNRILLELDFIGEERLSELLIASDVVVLPFQDIFTSGSLMMALTYGKPTIVPNIGLISDYVDPSCAFLYHPDEPEALFNVLVNALNTENLHELGQKAQERAGKFNWNDICKHISDLYRSNLCQT